MDALLQKSVLRVAVVLAVIDILMGVYHGLRLPLAHVRALAPLALLSAVLMFTLAFWLRRPRPIAAVHAAAGSSTLLISGTALLHLCLSQDLAETTDLMVIQLGAGFFLVSPFWFGVTSTFLGGGWILAVTTLPMEGRISDFAIAMGIALALSGVQHRVRRKLLGELVDQQAQELRKEAELEEALASIHTLRGLIPICAQCKKVRDDQGFWKQVEVYVEQHTEASFSHGLCPECLAATKAEWEREMRGD